MKKSKKFLIASGIGVAAGAALAAFLKKKNLLKKDSDYLTTDGEEEMFLDFSGNAVISYEEAEQKAVKFAQDKLGKDATVVSASDKKALSVNIEGKPRHCFMFGAACDSMSFSSETLLLYVDSSCGEVFDSNDIK